MRQLFRRGVVTIATGIVGAAVMWSSAMAQGEPPARVGRLAFTNGTVSFHDDEQSGWTPAVINTPLTTGDGIWTEPNARSEISLAAHAFAWREPRSSTCWPSTIPRPACSSRRAAST